MERLTGFGKGAVVQEHGPDYHSAETNMPGLFSHGAGSIVLAGLTVWSSTSTARADAGTTAASLPAPPATRAQPVTETVHGETLVDPYRWLEDGNAPAVKAWTAVQSAYTRRVLDAVPGRAELEARFWALHEIGSVGAPVARPVGHGRDRRWRYFYTRRDGKQNQAVLYLRDTGLRPGPDRALIDVNALAADGTRSLDWWFPSEDGALVAYGVSAHGTEESVLHVRDVQTGRDLPDVIERTRACSVAWLPDNSGFFYTRYPAPETVRAGEESYHRYVFLHRVGRASGADDDYVTGGEHDYRDWPVLAISPNGRFLALEVHKGWSRSDLYVLDRQAPHAPPLGQWHTIVADDNVVHEVVEMTNDALLVRTNSLAPRYRLVRVPLVSARHGGWLLRVPWVELIPEGPHTLQQVALVGRGKRLAALYLEDAVSRVRLFDAAGRPAGEVPLPGLGTVSGLSGHQEGDELFVPFTSYLAPTTIFVTPVGAGIRARSRATATAVWSRLNAPVDAAAFEVTKERARSKDGTEVPVFLVHRRGLPRDGRAPAVLYGYGGFNVNITPVWTPSVVPFLERGGVYAVAVLRGGGEFGENWHRAGMLGQKQNVFDDFIAAAEHLVARQVTRPDRLAIVGRSNGGLLTGAALTQRPELFRAVVCGVPLLDMLRYHHFRIAQLWTAEYGSPDDQQGFAWLRAYSPYHHVREGAPYPAVLFTTAASDTRVDPLHARKMTARLQAATAGSSRPVLLRFETEAGHGAGKPLGQVIAQFVDEWSFLFSELGVPPEGVKSAPP